MPHCKKKYRNSECQFCSSAICFEEKYPHKTVTLKYLRNSKALYSECCLRCKMYLKENIIYSASSTKEKNVIN